MKSVFKIIFSFLLLVGYNQPVQAQVSFGDRCIGSWEGMMYIYSKGTLKDSVSVRLTVQKANTSNTWTWKTEYLSAKLPMTKDYILRLPDPSTNKYITDEGDGIELTDYLYGNKLYSIFETHDVFLTSTYELHDKELIFEVISGKKEASTHPEINTYSTDNLQRVVLKKKM